MKTAITSGEFAGRLGRLERAESQSPRRKPHPPVNIKKTMEHSQFIDD